MTDTAKLKQRIAELEAERAEMVAAFKCARMDARFRGWTMRGFAAMCGISPVTLSKWTADEPTTEPDFVD